MGRKYGLSFSWKRALGISALRGNIARATGIPTTRSGMERKLGRTILSGCGFVLLVIIGFSASIFIGMFTDGKKDFKKAQAEQKIRENQQSIMPVIPQQSYSPPQQTYQQPQQTYQPQQNYQQPAQKNTNSSQVVYYTEHGKKYHRAGCSTIRDSQCYQTTLSQAIAGGLQPCRTCNP